MVTAPQDGIPLLFIEVDNCHETAEEIAAKLLKYSRFFKRQIKDTDGKDKPIWRTRWMARVAERGEAPHPPVLIVFNHTVCGVRGLLCVGGNAGSAKRFIQCRPPRGTRS
ncbi:hypothetical protein ABZ128_13715 [Streptomyces sp. NPDC006326]|uniref:hypothetical protein n=1 Tax=Streptomyces sp. NPDC006326 TaxID=3156752 RepID=UPI00339DE46B